MTPEEQLAKLLKQNQNIVFGRTLGTDPDGNCTVQTGESSILARSGGDISAGDCVALKADDGEWYAVSSRVTGTVQKVALFNRKNRLKTDDAVTTQIVFLFQKDDKLYIGGDRGEPELIYEASEGESIVDSRITKTEGGIGEYKAMFVAEKDGLTYLNTCIDGNVFTVDYEAAIIEEISFDMWDGSFIGIGTKSMFNEEDREAVVDRVAKLRGDYVKAVDDRRAEIIDNLQSEDYPGQYFDPVTERYYNIAISSGGREGEIPTTEGIKTFFGYIVETEGKSYKITSAPLGIIVSFSPPEEELISFYGGENVACFDTFGGRQCQIILQRTSAIVLSPSDFRPIPSPSISLFARPEDDILRDIEVDNYPAEERVLDVYYTEEKKISTLEFDNIKAFNSENIVFTKDEEILIRGGISGIIDLPTDTSVNNFISSTIYEVEEVEIEEAGTISANTVDISDPLNPATSTPVSVEYIGITSEFQDSIVNYSVFF